MSEPSFTGHVRHLHRVGLRGGPLRPLHPLDRNGALPAMSACLVGWAVSDAPERDLGMRQHLDRLAAEKERSDAAPPMRGHDDQITPFRGGGIDDRLIRMLALDLDGLACDTGCFAASAAAPSVFTS